MDKNTITGLILIFLIFIGFSIYNNNRLNKGFEEAVAAAETEIGNGNLERARTEYVNALRFKPNDPEVLKKINDLNVDLGITEDIQPEDSLKTDLSVTHQSQSQTQSQKKPSSYSDPGQYGVFANAATGQNDFITLENNLLELKISTKGGECILPVLRIM